MVLLHLSSQQSDALNGHTFHLEQEFYPTKGCETQASYLPLYATILNSCHFAFYIDTERSQVLPRAADSLSNSTGKLLLVEAWSSDKCFKYAIIVKWHMKDTVENESMEICWELL